MHTGEQPGTDPQPNFARKKKVRLEKKLPIAKPFSAKKTAEQNISHSQKDKSSHKVFKQKGRVSFQTERDIIIIRSIIAEAQKKEWNSKQLWNSASAQDHKMRQGLQWSLGCAT